MTFTIQRPEHPGRSEPSMAGVTVSFSTVANRLQTNNCVTHFIKTARTGACSIEINWRFRNVCPLVSSCLRHQMVRSKSSRNFLVSDVKMYFNLLKPTGQVMHQQFNIQQLYVLLTLYLCVLYLSENKQRLVPLTA